MKNDFEVIVDDDIVRVFNTRSGLQACINLKEGGRLSKWFCGDMLIIADPPESIYEDSFASAILFPFANRMERGQYQVEGKSYQLTLNDRGQHALHGLVYNQKFDVINRQTDSNSAVVELVYSSEGSFEGFPFSYDLFLTYRFEQSKMRLEVSVVNTDLKSFPFSLGWHPYFYVPNRRRSKINMPIDRCVVMSQDLIPKTEIPTDEPFNETLGSLPFDHCFRVSPSCATLKMTDYEVIVTSSKPKSYMQIYTPNHDNFFAIEPMTSPGNSFNHKIGLQKLSPKETFHLHWGVEFNDSSKS